MVALRTRFPFLTRVWPKKFFIFILVGTIAYINYSGLPSSMNIPAFFKNLAIKTTELIHGQRPGVMVILNKEWQQISVYDVFDKYKSQTSESCVNVCDAKNDTGCTLTNFEAWKKLVMSPDFNFIPLMSEYQYIYPWEAEYLSQPPMTDLKQIPSLTLSKVTIDGAVKNDVLCAVGDVINGRVHLVDGFGKQRIMGGDDVRVWIVDGQTKQNRAVGHVIDLRNGSYQISARCLWPGQIQKRLSSLTTTFNVDEQGTLFHPTPTRKNLSSKNLPEAKLSLLKVALAYPREYLRTVIHRVRILIARFNIFKFKKGDIEEDTICHSTPNIPGRPCLCNLTETNQQSLYCGRPLDSRLGCYDWIQTHNLPVSPARNVTPAELQFITGISKGISNNLISHNYTITASGAGSFPALKPCKETNPKVTWELSNQPTGYWTAGDKWESLVCYRPNMTSEWATSCLKNTSFWVFGDSNGFAAINVVLDVVRTTVVKDGEWPTQFIKENAENNILLTFTPLEFPLYPGKAWWNRFPYGGVAKQIDNIPSTGAHVVVIHYYLHIAFSHHSVAYHRLKAARDAIERLLNRNPNVIVGIRGPHVSSVQMEYNHASGGDTLGMYLLQMTLDVFDGLKHKVVFLDGWEMTIANENGYYHPSKSVPFELMRTLLAFKCS